MQMRLSISLAVLLALTAAAAAAPRAHVSRIEIVAAGLFKSKIAKREPSPGSASGTRFVVARETLLRRTTRIAARPGVEFGIRYRIVGAPKGAKVRVRIATIYPRRGLRNPQLGKPVKREEFTAERAIGRTLYESYRFDHPWELVPGTWTFQIWYGKRMAEQSFIVLRP